MTQDEVLKELHSVIAGNQQFTTWTVSTPHLVELVNRAVKAEREACAKVCDGLADTHEKMNQWGSHKTADTLAQAIRARGEQA
jgi:hypothetical protein